MLQSPWRLLVLALGAALGCGKSAPPAPPAVRGTVTFQGRPLAGGLIVFAPDREKGTEGKAASAVIGDDGRYAIATDGGPLAAGWYRVAIAEPPGMGGGEYGVPRFPAALRRPDRSGLDRELHPGANVLDFQIEVSE